MAKTLGDFLEIQYWQNAISLEKAQINFSRSNKHFKTLNTLYFGQFDDDTWKLLQNRAFYEEEIASNIFWLKPGVFFTTEYQIPKYPGYSFRDYTFFSLPMRLLYNSIGLYILELSKPIIKTTLKNSHIKSYYGGNLTTKKSNKLDTSINNLYYRDYYKSFKKDIEREINSGNFDLVIKFDIKDFFPNIDIYSFLSKIGNNTTESHKRKFNFDEEAITQIKNFFSLINPSGGIPQGDNLIISNAIGNLFLSLIDMEVEEYLISNKNISSYKIIRYLDDFYLFLKVSRTDLYELSAEILLEVTNLIKKDFGLSTNRKTRITNLKSQKQKEKLLNDIKKVSIQDYYDPQKNEDEDVAIELLKETLEQINNIISNTESSETFAIGEDLEEIEESVLNSIYSKKIRKKIQQEETLKEIFEELAMNFNYQLTRISPKPLTIFYLLFEGSKNNYIKYLKTLNKDSIYSFELIKNFVIQDNLKDTTVLDLLLSSDNLDSRTQSELSSLKEPNKIHLDFQKTGYFNLNGTDFRKLIKKTSVKDEIIFQGSLRVLSEKENKFDLAISHLINEFTCICFAQDKKNSLDLEKYYRKNDIQKNLFTQPKQQLKMEKLFDKRHHNNISHINTKCHNITDSRSYIDHKKIVEELITVIK